MTTDNLGGLELGAEAWATERAEPGWSAAHLAIIASQALSLKRIADALDVVATRVDQPTTMGMVANELEGIREAIQRLAAAPFSSSGTAWLDWDREKPRKLVTRDDGVVLSIPLMLEADTQVFVRRIDGSETDMSQRADSLSWSSGDVTGYVRAE